MATDSDLAATAAAKSEQLGASKPVRIGILLGDLGKLNTVALKYLIVHLNTLQRSFEFEVLPTDPTDSTTALLRSGVRVDRPKVRDQLSAFKDRTRVFLSGLSDKYDLAQKTVPEKFILLTLSTFTDYYYSVSVPNIRLLALGDWESHMAPPSLLEASITHVMRQAVGLVSTSLSTSIHLGTKGCLFDFTDSLDEARFKTLHGFICSECRAAMRADNPECNVDEILRASDSCKWIGKSDDATSPAGIVAKLGYDLFLTRGVSPTAWEKARAALRDEGMKEFIKLGFGILLAALLVWLGLKR